MNKKYLNPILIILLVLIWGSVIYKYFGKPNKSQTISGLVNPNSNYKYDYKITKDTFDLKLTNQNPFKTYKKRRTLASSSKSVSTSKKQKTKPVKTNIKWPTITYHGFVKGDKKTTRLILLKINNRLYRKREKETINKVTLIKAFNDSLIVMFNNNKKNIKKIDD